MKNDKQNVASWLKTLASQFGVSQQFGNKNPKVEVFSKGVNTGTDIRTPQGTPINLPKGNWRVLEAFGGASGMGHIGNAVNRGYGNSVLVQNLDTGEKYRFSHLSAPTVQQGQYIPGGLIGLTGATGNVTGAHLDLEYYDPKGRLADVFKSNLASLLPYDGTVTQPVSVMQKGKAPSYYETEQEPVTQPVPKAISYGLEDTETPPVSTPSAKPIPKPNIIPNQSYI